jgi:hypothetical protein
MPGPMSAPNGDARLVAMTAEQRAELLEKNQLSTGKTEKRKSRPSRE